MPLTDTVVRGAKPRGRQHKLADGGGLYLLVRPNGSKLWQWDYRRPITRMRNTIGPGAYPDVTLAAARDWRAEQRRLLAAGVDPGEHRKDTKRAGEERAANTFEAIAREWLAVRKRDWTPKQHDKERDRLENHAFPWIGRLPISDVGVAHVRPLLTRVADRGHHEQARRLRSQLSRIFRFAIASERSQNNPADALLETLPLRHQKNYPRVLPR
jgi:hypothetical protein